MTKLISGRVKKIHSANVSASRYEFIRLSETEPDLGLPAGNSYTLTSNVDGTRHWAPFVPGIAYLADTANLALSAVTANTANTVLAIDNFTTSNLVEGTNLYYTNARVNSYVTPLLTTANVVESASNLYFTNARAVNALVGQDVDLNNLVVQGNLRVQGDTTTINTATVIVEDKNILLGNGAVTLLDVDGAGITIALSGAALIYRQVGDRWEINKSLYSNDDIYAHGFYSQEVYSNVWTNIYTSNVIENTNLYYTNARVVSAVTPYLTTANVVEVGNLYYTNARVQNYLENVDGSILPIAVGAYDIGSETRPWRDLWLQGTSIKFANSGAISAQANTFTIIDIGGNVVFTANATNIPITSPDGKLSAALISDIPNLSTSNIKEGSNLYYTDARVYANISAASINALSDVDTVSTPPSYGQALTWNGSQWVANTIAFSFVENANTANTANTVTSISNFTTSDLAEGTNLYYDNTRVDAYVTPLIAVKANITDLTTANVAELNNLYYTNDRVYSNVIELLPSYAGNVNAGNITIGSGTGGSLIGANLIRAVTVQADNWIGIYTANVIESASNLYYNVERANTAIDERVTKTFVDALGIDATTLDGIDSTAFALVTDLTTANVVESASNLYYTVERANTAIDNRVTKTFIDNLGVTSSNAVFAENANVANSVTSISNFTTSNLVEGTNLYYTNSRVLSYVTPLIAVKANVTDLTTANVIESNSNLYYTNARVEAYIAPLLAAKGNVSDLTTANIVELNNLYYTNSRVYSNVIGLLNAKANVVDLTTSNVIEGNNLYYTNTRVESNVIGILVNYATVSNLALKANIVDLTTANVAELNNLYYTNSRVESNVIGILVNYATVSNLALKANIVDLTTANVAELNNLYYTNSRVLSYVTPLLAVKANVVDLTTSNVVEGDNLYYTNARVRSTLSSGTGVSYDKSTGVISIGQNVDSHANVTFNEMTVTGNLNVVGNLVGFYANTLVVNDPLIQLGYGNPSDALDLGFLSHYNDGIERHAGLFRDASDKKFKFFDNLTGEPGSPVVDTANATFRLANVAATTFEGNVVGNVTGYVSSIGNFSTSDLVEGTNLYYTNSRVLSYVTPYLNAKANVTDLTTSNVIEGNNLYYTNSRVLSYVTPYLNAKANVTDLTTSNVIEGNNLYYTNARVNAQVESNLALKANITDLTTSNIIEGNNLYYTNARVRSTISAGDTSIIYDPVAGTIKANASITASIEYQINNLTTTSITEGNNLYYTNSRVYSNVVTLLPTLAGTGIAIEANGQIRATTSVSSLVGLNTANVLESASNLYYTVARANTAIDHRVTKAFIDNLGVSSTSALFAEHANVANTVVSISNFTTSDLAEGTNLYYTNSRVYANVIGLLDAKANIVDLTTDNVIELNSLYYTNTRVYSNVIELLPNYTGNVGAGNVTIGSGTGGSLVGANLLSATNIQADNWLGIYTANVVESASNLYFTNARAIAAFTNQDISLSNVNTYNLVAANTLFANGLVIQGLAVTNSILAGNISSNLISAIEIASSNIFTNSITSNIWNNLYTANIIETADNLYFTNARVYANVISLLNVKANVADLTTANVFESAGNLYYTVDRANTAIDNRVTKSFVENLNISVSFANTANTANTVTSISNFTTSDLAEGTNLYYTNSRVLSYVTPYLTTANVIESASNLYYTNARARAALSGGTGVSYDSSTGVIAIGQNVSPNASVTFAGVSIYGPLNVYGNVTTHASNNLSISDNMIYLNSGSEISNPDLGIAFNYNDGVYHHAGFFRDHTDGRFKVFDNYTPEPDANVYIDTNHATFRLANIQANVVFAGLIGNVTGYVSSIDNFSTSNLIEGTRLYYTNARVNAQVQSNLALKANVVDLTTANVAELNNLYYTNARVYSNVIGLLNAKANVVDLTTSNVAELNNLYYTNARVYSNVIGLLNAKANVVDLTTSNVVELNNLYYTNARVYSNVIGLLNAKANIVDLTTSNVVELNNLYYTNSRVYSNVIGLLNAKANIVDLTTSNVVELNNLYYTNSRVYSNVVSLLPNYTGNITAGNITLSGLEKLQILGGTDGYILETDGFGNLSWQSRISNTIVYVGNSLVQTNGVYVSGDITSTQTYGDYANANGVYTLTDGTGSAPAWYIDVDFLNVTIFNRVVLNINYTQASGHTIYIQLYNNTTSAWDNIGTYTGLGSYYAFALQVIDSIPYTDVGAGNKVKLRLYHSNAGNAGHTTNIDYIALEQSQQGPQGPRGPTGATGATGATGNGLISGGTTGQVLIKNSNTSYDTAWTSSLNLSGNINAGNIISSNWIGITTANVAEINNLYYTNSRVYSNVIELLPTLAGSGIAIAANGRISANAILAQDIIGLNTANVAETNDSLYYTNARVYSNVVALLPNVGVTINSSYQQFVSNGTATVFTLNNSVASETSIFVVIDGLVQTPTLDYTASGTTLTLTSTPADLSNIVVRYFSAVLVP